MSLRENLAHLYHEAIGSPGNGRRLDTSRRRKKGGAVVKRGGADFWPWLLVAAPSLLMGAQGHEDTASNLLLALVVLLPAAKLSGGVAVRVILPFCLGWFVSALLLPDRSYYVHTFIGATLCATSVGITARVLQDLDAIRTPEAKIILGASVIDDILGLLILAVVSGMI